MDGEKGKINNYFLAATAGALAGGAATGFAPSASETVLDTLGYQVTYTEACGAMGCWDNGVLNQNTEQPLTSLPVANTVYDAVWGTAIFGSILGAYLLTRKVQHIRNRPSTSYRTLDDRLAKVNIGHPHVAAYELERSG